MKEKRRVEASKVSGAETYHVYISHWEYFNELKFLNINSKAISTESSFMQSSLMTQVEADEDILGTEAETNIPNEEESAISSETRKCKQTGGQKRKKTFSPADEVFRCASVSQQTAVHRKEGRHGYPRLLVW